MPKATCLQCGATAKGDIAIINEMLQRHMAREHDAEGVCSLCGGDGSIEAVPTPIACPACSGSGFAAGDDPNPAVSNASFSVDEDDQSTLERTVERLRELAEGRHQNWVRFKELFDTAATVTVWQETVARYDAGEDDVHDVQVDIEATYVGHQAERVRNQTTAPLAHEVENCLPNGSSVTRQFEPRDDLRERDVERVHYKLFLPGEAATTLATGYDNGSV